MKKMCRLDFVIAFVLVPCYMISKADIQSASEDSTPAHFENYDSQSSDELFDPMKQSYRTYEDFLTSGSRHYTLTELLSTSTVSLHRVSEAEAITEMEFEPTTMKPEDVVTDFVPNSVNDIVGSRNDPSPQPLVDILNASELSSSKQAKMFVSLSGEQHEHLAQLHAEGGEETAAVAMYSRNITEDFPSESKKPVNPADSVLASPQFATIVTTEVTYPLPSTDVSSMTVAPAEMTTTTLSSIPTTVVPLLTTPASTVAPNGGKKPKKIESPTHFFKYSADEILRKYLEDIHIRAPLATLINTSPATLRKAKMLWTSTLRPNSPIDIVLVAFNSSGKLPFTLKNK